MILTYKPAEGPEVHFNAELAAAKSVEDFTKHEKHHEHLSKEQLAEVHALCVKAVKGDKKEAAQAPAGKTEATVSKEAADGTVESKELPVKNTK